MSGASTAIEQMFKEVGWVAKWEAQGKAIEALKIARNMVAFGLPFETIVSTTQLEPEKVKELYQ